MKNEQLSFIEKLRQAPQKTKNRVAFIGALIGALIAFMVSFIPLSIDFLSKPKSVNPIQKDGVLDTFTKSLSETKDTFSTSTAQIKQAIENGKTALENGLASSTFSTSTASSTATTTKKN